MEVAIENFGDHLYQLMTGAICPRPIAWASTINTAGRANLAPFSFFTVASVNPPMLCFAPQNSGDQRVKDTIANLREVPECVINICNEPLARLMNETAATLARGMDEFEHAGIDKAAMSGLKVPRVRDAPFAFGCTLHDIVSFGDHAGAGQLVLARIIAIHASDELWDGRHVDIPAMQAIGRTVGSGYARVTDTFDMTRPD